MFISFTLFSGNLLTRHSSLSDTVALRHAPHFSSSGKAQTDIFEPVHRNTPNQPLFGVHEPLKGHGVPRDPDPEEVRRRQEEIAAEMRRRNEERQQRFQEAEEQHHSHDILQNSGRRGRHSNRPPRNRQVSSNQPPPALPNPHIDRGNPFLPATSPFYTRGDAATYPAVGHHNGNRYYAAGIIRQRPGSNLLHYFSQSGDYQGYREA